jgi:hypothetical protein
MTWYYAHSMLIYNTQRERDEYERLKMLVRDVINPNTDIERTTDMSVYNDAVRKSYGVICSEIEGHIGKGVFTEITTAFSENKKVYVLRKNTLIPVKGVVITNDKDWKLSYGKVIT